MVWLKVTVMASPQLFCPAVGEALTADGNHSVSTYNGCYPNITVALGAVDRSATCPCRRLNTDEFQIVRSTVFADDGN